MEPHSARPILGVVGGMGPAATADFLYRITRLTPSDRDQDHIPTLVYSDTTTPDRSDAILQAGPSPLPALLRAVEFLNSSKCGLLAIPCNSAHYWFDDLAAASEQPILHIADATAHQISISSERASLVGIMATDGTLQADIYGSRLERAGYSTIGPDTNGRVMQGIRALKAGDDTRARASLLAGGRDLARRGAQALVLGCTDISAAIPDVKDIDGVPVVDASECLAAECVNRLT